MSNMLSILLGVISTILGVWSVYLALHYRKVDEKINDINTILSSIQNEKLNALYTIMRDLEKNMDSSNKLSLNKDTVAVIILQNYKPSQETVVIAKLKTICPCILKDVYINKIISVLISENGIDNKPIYVTLRSEYNRRDLNKIQAVNTEMEPLGLHFEYLCGAIPINSV